MPSREDPEAADPSAPLLGTSTSSNSTHTRVSDPPKGLKPYGSGTAFAIAINYIVGTGAFGMPHGFAKTGLILNAILLFSGYLLVLQGVNYILEFMARANTVRYGSLGTRPVHRLTYEKQDFSKCAEVFQGEKGVWAMQFYLTWYAIGILWSYASIFGSSAALIYGEFIGDRKCEISSGHASSECLQYFYIALAIYAVAVIALASMDIGDQAGVQMFLTFYKLVATILMLATLATKLVLDRHLLKGRIEEIGLFNFSNFSIGFSPSILGLGAGYNFPDVLQPLKDKSKSRLVAFGSLTLSTVLYLILGVMGAIAFSEVDSLITLNWYDFTGCGSTGWSPCPESHKSVNWIGTVVQIFVLMYPMLNVLSAYPLVCVTVGDNWRNLVHEEYQKRVYVIKGFRVVAAIVPIILAFCFKKLDIIFIVCGLGGFLLNLIGPASLQISSIQVCAKKWNFIEGPTAWKTEFSSWFSSPRFAWGLFVVSTILFIVAIVLSF